MKDLKSHFKFNKQERSGIFFLLLLIVLLQGVYFFVKYNSVAQNDSNFVLDGETQAKIDSLQREGGESDSKKIYPFNPNFITDYKGYTLGLTHVQIDRLHEFRKQNKYVNSATEFQEVTGVSDSLLQLIAPYFRFPEWVRDKQVLQNTVTSETVRVKKQDLNSVTAEELKSVYGIGDKLSARIIKYRELLGGFLVDEQLEEVYGLEPGVVARALEKFTVMNPPQVVKINLNTASHDELASLVYINNTMARKIIAYRQLNGRINSFDELKGIDGFPSGKIARIRLYLTL